MSLFGFEGFEKRLELHFFRDDTINKSLGERDSNSSLGLRLLDFETLDKQILQVVQCTVVSAVANRHFDAYVLSESSLFVYPTKIIIKTCGTTQLLKSVAPLLRHATRLGLTLTSCLYTRGTFIFPKAQPFPHDNFQNEVVYLEASLPESLSHRKASVMPSKTPSHSWHVFSASTKITSTDFSWERQTSLYPYKGDVTYTIEICMTEVDRNLARNFYPEDGKKGDVAGEEMTAVTGIGEIIPSSLICEFAFDPCGYSMNGVDGNRHSTIHVTPEDGFSYASYECVGSVYDCDDVVEVLRRVFKVFRPAIMSVATTCVRADVWKLVSGALEPLGMECRSCALDKFPAAGNVVYQTFTARRNNK